MPHRSIRRGKRVEKSGHSFCLATRDMSRSTPWKHRKRAAHVSTSRPSVRSECQPSRVRSARRAPAVLVAVDPVDSAKMGDLQYVEDRRPGIRRVRSGRHFRYLDASNRVIRRRAVLDRIRSLAIPPAWTEVWICPRSDGHLQATGRDARGRKQYIYHPQWREVRDDSKYEHMLAFAQSLPAIRVRVAEDLDRKGLPREKVLAAVVRLLEATL